MVYKEQNHTIERNNSEQISLVICVFGIKVCKVQIIFLFLQSQTIKTEYTMSKEVQNRVTYMICCVSAFANHFGLSFKQAYSYLKRFKGISFLDECYEAEHQLSISDAVSDLSIICHRNGGALV